MMEERGGGIHGGKGEGGGLHRGEGRRGGREVVYMEERGREGFT